MASHVGKIAAIAALLSTGMAVAQEAQNAQEVGDGVVLDAITVTGSSDATEGSSAWTAEIPTTTASGLPVTPRETPQSVSVVTQQQIIDQNARTLTDVLAFSTGITALQGNGELRYGYFARGSEITNQQIDGVASWSHWFLRDIAPQDNMAMFDRVEIVRGATGLLEGAGYPSASVNLVRKRGTYERRIEGVLSAQSWGNVEATADLAGPLNETRTLRGRFVASGLTGNGWRDDMEHDNSLLYGALDADLGERTIAGFGLAYQTENIDGYSWGGVPTTPEGEFFPFYDARTASALPWEFSQRRMTTAFVDITHELGAGWTITGKGRAAEGETHMLSSYMFWDYATDTLIRTGGNFDYDNRSFAGDVRVTGPVSLFGRRHDLVFGLSGNRDYTSYDTPDEYRFAVPDPRDLQDPDGPGPSPLPLGNSWNDDHQTQWGVYGNGRFRVTDALSVFAGGRVSWYESRSVAVWGTSSYDVDAEFTPYVGAVYDVNDDWTVYASYTGIFQPQSQLVYGGGFIDPIEGTNAEVGVKAGFLDGGLEATAALFQTEQDNLPVDDLSSPCPPGLMPPCWSTPGETVRIRGIDLELTGAVTPRWNLMAGYTWQSAEFVEGPSEGERYDPETTPEHLLRLATTYALPGRFEGLTLGADMQAQSGIYADGESWPDLIPFRIEQPGWAVFGAMARYAFDERTGLQLTVDNLFDKRYYSAIADTGYGNFIGHGRSATLTLRRLF
jgi:outer-membrane receptor for ferric coprogen and ferric-rhodotorulic acid